MIYFASGSNRACEVRAFTQLDQPVGVAATELSASGERELVALAGTGQLVFVDSGAFSEVRPEGGQLVVVKPITPERWREILALYRRLAVALGSQLYVVAPDRVGCQGTTLGRLMEHDAALRDLRALGANILVPLQGGALSLAAFDVACAAALGFNDYVRALPMKKGATTDEALVAYLRDCQPARVHLLGMGPKNRRMPSVAAAFAELSPATELSCDSNLILANVGRTPKRRPLTVARDKAAALIKRGLSPILDVQELGILIAFGGAPA